MIRLKENIDTIEQLLNEGTERSLSYAALECRLAIELVCYDRLRIAHEYISHDDVKRWQPKEVVNRLIQDVDEHIASTFTLSLSTEPAGSSEIDMTVEDYGSLEFIPVGTQVGFDAKNLGKLWNTLSSFLHVNVPKSVSDSVSRHGNSDALKRKIREVVSELKRLELGTLVSSGVGETVYFQCNCGVQNNRRSSLLKNGQTINCINPDCLERWDAILEDNDIAFKRRSISINCRKCSKEAVFPERPVLELPRGTAAYFICETIDCKQKNHFMWRLAQVEPEGEGLETE